MPADMGTDRRRCSLFLFIICRILGIRSAPSLCFPMLPCCEFRSLHNPLSRFIVIAIPTIGTQCGFLLSKHSVREPLHTTQDRPCCTHNDKCQRWIWLICLAVRARIAVCLRCSLSACSS